MLRFLHISDLHFRSKLKESTGVTARLSYIKDNYPDHKLIVTGDITDDGDDRQYDRAWHWLPQDAFIVPGNHDYGKLGNFYDHKRAASFQAYFQPGRTRWSWPIVETVETDTEKVCLIGCDTNIRSWWPADFARGRLGAWQRRRLRKTLLKYSDYAKIVVFHHHPFCRGFTMEMEDANKVLAILGVYADIVLFGHKHASQEWLGKPYYVAAGKFDEQKCVTGIEVTGRNWRFTACPVCPST